MLQSSQLKLLAWEPRSVALTVTSPTPFPLSPPRPPQALFLSPPAGRPAPVSRGSAPPEDQPCSTAALSGVCPPAERGLPGKSKGGWGPGEAPGGH